MMVTHRTNPISTQEIAIANPPKTIHRILPMILIAGSLRSTIFRKTPDGMSDLHSMVLVLDEAGPGTGPCVLKR